jgi:preprotein translocase subunit SecA
MKDTAGRGADPQTGATVQTIVKPEVDENDPTTWEQTPRNAPCPCGSGKKYKHCHGSVG